MERFVRMSLEELHELCAGCRFADVAYPPGLEPAVGSFAIRRLEQGGIKVEVDRCSGSVDDFVLSVLFGTGGCIFSGSRALAEFFRSTVAAAFGIEGEPLPPEVEPAASCAPPCDDGVNREPEAAAERGSEPLRRPPRPRKRRPAVVRPRELVARLARDVHGQSPALGAVARAVANHLAKPFPARPETIVLLGPTGTGKTATVEALPGALAALDAGDHHVFRIDCNELAHDSDLRRVLGAPPSYIGYVEEPPLVAALREPGCILLLDEVEKATRAVFDVFLGLLDEGRLTAPDGETVDAPGIVVALTTNEGADDLAHTLRQVPAGGRAEADACREHLLRAWWPSELVGRLGAFAVYEPLAEEARRGVAEKAIRTLAAEYGVAVDALEPVLADVVRDLADTSEIGARALSYAARDLLADAFADAARAGLEGRVRVEAGPPPRVVAVAG